MRVIIYIHVYRVIWTSMLPQLNYRKYKCLKVQIFEYRLLCIWILKMFQTFWLYCINSKIYIIIVSFSVLTTLCRTRKYRYAIIKFWINRLLFQSEVNSLKKILVEIDMPRWRNWCEYFFFFYVIFYLSFLEKNNYRIEFGSLIGKRLKNKRLE